jgi:hypothetical protein
LITRQLLHIDLCVPNGIANVFGTLRSFLTDHDLLYDASRLSDDSLFRKFLDFDYIVARVSEFGLCCGAIHGPTLNADVILCEVDAFFDRPFDHARIDTYTASQYSALPDLQFFIYDGNRRAFCYLTGSIASSGASCGTGSGAARARGCCGSRSSARLVTGLIAMKINRIVTFQNVRNRIVLILARMHTQNNVATSHCVFVAATFSIIFGAK